KRRNPQRITQHDAVSTEVARAKLASARDHARPGHFWGGSDLQRYFLAHRSVRSGFLAKAGELGSCRRLCVYGDQFDSLPLGPLGRVADVFGGHSVSHPDEVYWHQSLRG